MKGTALSALFAAATLLASPVFAAEDLCTANLQKI
ncbi:tmRNA, partial [Pseudomonas monteilii]